MSINAVSAAINNPDAQKLADGDWRVFTIICEGADRNGMCDPAPSQDTIADKCDTTKRTVQNRLKSLESAGVLERTRTGNGRGIKTAYKILIEIPAFVKSEALPEKGESSSEKGEKSLQERMKNLEEKVEKLCDLLTQLVQQKGESSSEKGEAESAKGRKERVKKGEAAVSPDPVDPLLHDPFPEPVAQKPPRDEINEAKAQLEKYFSAKTTLSVPARRTQKQKSAAAVRWWNPLAEIYELCGYDLEQSRRLIDAAIAKMDAGQLDYDAPQSILSVARSTYAQAQRAGTSISPNGGNQPSNLHGLRGV